MFRGQGQAKFPLEESEVLEYIKRLQTAACAVSHKLTQNYVPVTVTSHGIPAGDFKASSSGMAFMHQNELSQESDGSR